MEFALGSGPDRVVAFNPLAHQSFVTHLSSFLPIVSLKVALLCPIGAVAVLNRFRWASLSLTEAHLLIPPFKFPYFEPVYLGPKVGLSLTFPSPFSFASLSHTTGLHAIGSGRTYPLSLFTCSTSSNFSSKYFCLLPIQMLTLTLIHFNPEGNLQLLIIQRYKHVMNFALHRFLVLVLVEVSDV